MTDHSLTDAEMRQVIDDAYIETFVSIVTMLETYAGLAKDYGVAPVTITPSGDARTDIISMHRAVHAMAAGVLALVDARPVVTN